MNKIQSENLSQKPAAVINEQYPAFLMNDSTYGCFMQRQKGERGFRMNKKGGEQQFVSDQKITKQENYKYIMTLIRRMEVKQ